MAGLFWGSSFLLATVYALVANHVTRLAASRGRQTPGFLELHLPAAVSAPGEPAAASLSVSLPRVFLPGFVIRFALPLSWENRRIDGVRAPLAPGKNVVRIAFQAAHRGDYRAENAVFDVRDILGLTSGRFRVPVKESVKVYPRLNPTTQVRQAQDGGEAPRYAIHKRKSDELLEVRKYYPGDDVRKLNWKVFAHINELFVRIGEQTPPPQSRLLFIVDSTANEIIPPFLRDDYLDCLVEACASAMAAMLGGGAEVFFIWPGVSSARPFGQESISDLMGVCAGLSWVKPGWLPTLPARAGMHGVVFSTPGSPELARVMNELRSRGWKASLFLKDLVVPHRLRGVTKPRDLLILPPEGTVRRSVPVPSARSLETFRDALRRTQMLYGASVALMDKATGVPG